MTAETRDYFATFDALIEAIDRLESPHAIHFGYTRSRLLDALNRFTYVNKPAPCRQLTKKRRRAS